MKGALAGFAWLFSLLASFILVIRAAYEFLDGNYLLFFLFAGASFIAFDFSFWMLQLTGKFDGVRDQDQL